MGGIKTGTRVLTIVYWILTALPLLMTIVAFSSIPDGDVAINFDVSGQPNRWGSRWDLLMFPLEVGGFSILMFCITSLSAKNSSQPIRNRTIGLVLLLGALLVFNVISVWGIVWNVPYLHYYFNGLDLSGFFYVYIGAMMVFVGLLIVNLTKNLTIGARVPWNLTEKSWNKLQHFARSILVGAGVVEVAGCAFLLRGTVATVFTISLVTIICILILGFGLYLRAVDKR